MKLKVTNLTEACAKEICNWKYDDEYSVYNYPEWSRISSEKWAITIEEKRKDEFNAIVDDGNILYGYIRLINKDKYILIGVGLKPCVCGQGLGNDLMEIVKGQCRKLYPGKKIVLEVRAFNKRAIKCYKRAGFSVVDTYKKDTPIGYGEFVKMECTY
ncbi:GNAT family N-acetyltransferase [Clostridium sp. P21]|uniref:GNAT family N-acetyltransferase n=1 Tax=Clostridium muellerianum TaxID=2716538 RepID=A0A7Y0HN73_9CLOT|nr:GNAT family N-acetyltransferase [Clostridium muellerianum]NMM63704.1 GNAT family N-acetyltransferase [Clostridium muellerianum]